MKRRQPVNLDDQVAMLPGFKWPKCSGCGRQCFHADLKDGRCQDCAGENGPNLLTGMTA